MFCIYLRTNNDLCHLQHKLIGFITEKKSVYSAVRTESLNIAGCVSSLKGYYKLGSVKDLSLLFGTAPAMTAVTLRPTSSAIHCHS